MKIKTLRFFCTKYMGQDLTKGIMAIKVKTGIFTESGRPTCCEHFLKI